MPYPYTLEILQRFDYNRARCLFQSDAEKVNRLCQSIAAMRSGDPVPTDGDKILCVTPTGEQVSHRGYLERRENQLMVCSCPSRVHLDGRLYTTAGGGPWSGYMDQERFLQQAEYMGKAMSMFWTWGMWGSTGGGGIVFEAEVFLWHFASRSF